MARRVDLLVVGAQYLALADVHETRIVHLDDPSTATFPVIENGEGRIADLTLLANRQSIHHNFRRATNLQIAGDEF